MTVIAGKAEVFRIHFRGLDHTAKGKVVERIEADEFCNLLSGQHSGRFGQLLLLTDEDPNRRGSVQVDGRALPDVRKGNIRLKDILPYCKMPDI